MNQPVNPYVVGAPTCGEQDFFGRQDTLEWVARELQNPSAGALFLLGQPAIGKTSLLLQLERTLPADAFLSVYFDLQGQAARPLGQVLAGLAAALAGRAGLTPPGPALFDDEGNFFLRAFLPRFCAVALRERQRLIFLLDEFDAPDGATEGELPHTTAVKAFFPFVQRVMAGDSRPAFVLAAGRLDLVSVLDPALVREVGVLDWESAEALVRQAETNGTLQFSALAISHLLSLTGCHPYLTQLLCQQVWERAYAERPTEAPLIDTVAVDAALPDVLAASDPRIAWTWDGLGPTEGIYAAATVEGANDMGGASEERVCWVASSDELLFETEQDFSTLGELAVPARPAVEFQQEDIPSEEAGAVKSAPVGEILLWLRRVREALSAGRYVETLRLALPVVVVPVFSVLAFYGIGVSLAGGMSNLAWLPAPFDASTFYRFGLVSAILGLFPGLQFAYEFIKRPALTLELAYLSFYKYVRPFLAVILIYTVLVLLTWISQASVSEDEWEGFQIFFSWLQRLWEK
jgi:hypothetical protein